MYWYVVGKLPLPWPGFPQGLPRGTVLTDDDAKAFEANPHLRHFAQRIPAGSIKLRPQATLSDEKSSESKSSTSTDRPASEPHVEEAK